MKKIKSYFSKYRGFTLSELLAVAVILAILAVMATGSFRLSTEKARFTEGLQTAEKVAAAMERFYYDNPSLPYLQRIYPTMDQLDLSFTDMGECTVTTQLAGGDDMSTVESCINSSEMESFMSEDKVEEIKESAKEYAKHCKRIGKFEVSIDRADFFGKPCITTVTALRGGEKKLRCNKRTRDTSGPHPTWNDDGYFELSSRGSGPAGEFSYRDYEIDVYPSFFDGSTGLSSCAGDDSRWIASDLLLQKKVACVGLERLCATMGFTHNADAARQSESSLGINVHIYRWVRP